jgi:hypothetical protein
MSKKYLSEAEILALLGEIIIDNSFVPMSQDSYNESAVVQAIKDTNREPELCMAAINMACVGYGNKRYGNYKYKNQICDISKLLVDTGVKINLPKDSKLKEEDLTPQRLCRAFRNQIRDYVKQNHYETYLYRKYSDHNPKYAHLLFRGSEYLDDLKPDETAYILDTYRTMDISINTNISERIKRVFQAKGYVRRTYM